jgi:hypothetical protein
MTQTTTYFREQVLRKRPYLTEAMCRAIIADPILVDAQDDGRVRFWGWANLQGEAETRILRIVTLSDRTTIHNAFPDRNFRQEST